MYPKVLSLRFCDSVYLLTLSQRKEFHCRESKYITDLPVLGMGLGGRDPILRINTHQHRTGDEKCRGQSIKG